MTSPQPITPPTPQQITLSSTVVASPRQVSTRVEDEMVILGLDDGVYYGLDGVGARAWELMQAPRPVSEISAAIRDEYEVDPERCDADLLALLHDLHAHGLVEVRDERAA